MGNSINACTILVLRTEESFRSTREEWRTMLKLDMKKEGVRIGLLTNAMTGQTPSLTRASENQFSFILLLKITAFVNIEK
jgi:hypothetical protein